MPYQSRLELQIDSRGAERGLRRVEGGLDRVDRAGDRADDSIQGLGSSLGGLRTIAMAAGGALAAIGIGQFSRDNFAAIQSSQQLRASLKTVTGSAEAATAAWENLLQFAAETPFTLEQSVQGFIRMKSLGLDPTNEALRSFGNTASAMGKDMMQMVEAVADATTGEFERLKEFGIRASKEGDQITFTFQGVETTVRNSSEAISEYLQGIGENQFAGAMADQMDTLGGKASNLEDSIYQLYLAIGEAGATDAFNAALDGSISATEYLTDNIDGLGTATETLAVLAGGRLVTALGNSTAAKARDMAASVQSAKAEAAAAQQVARRTAAERTAAMARLASAKTEEQATRGTAAHAFALNQLSAARVRAAEAAGAHTAATNTATAAMARASVAARGMAAASRAGAAAMTALGGPLGLLIGGAGLLYVFRDELNLTGRRLGLTEQQVADFQDELDDMSNKDMSGSLSSLNAELQEAALTAAAARDEIARLREESSDPGPFRQSIVMGSDADERRAAYSAYDAAKQNLAEIEQQRNMTRVEWWGRLADQVTTVTAATNKNANSVTVQSEATKEAAKTAKEAARQAEQFASSLQSLEDRLFPVEAAQRQFRQEQIMLQTALMQGKIGIERYIEANERLNESMRSDKTWQEAYGFDGNTSDIDKVSDSARELGLTFTSAFEDAVIEGENFRGVLQGIFEDIQRILIRRTITEPAETAISGALDGFSWGGLFNGLLGGGGGGGTYTGGTVGSLYPGMSEGGYTGDGGKYDPAGIVHRGEFVVKKSVVDNPGVRPMLERLNKGYANGGYVGPSSSAAGGGISVHIHNEGGEQMQVGRREERRGAGGQRELHLWVNRIVDQRMKQNFQDGYMDRQMQRTYGVRRG